MLTAKNCLRTDFCTANQTRLGLALTSFNPAQ